MRRTIVIAGLLALGACADSDALNNGRSAAYLVDGYDKIDDARRQATAECGQINREPRLSNVTAFQRVLAVFDCQPPGNVRFETRVNRPTP